MTTDFSFFESSLKTKRTYRTPYTANVEMLMDHDEQGVIEMVSESVEEMVFRATHLLKPGFADGIRSVERKFEVTLPQDMHDFYRRWGSGYLVFLREYRLMPPSEIIEEVISFRTIRKERADMPKRMFRFCELEDSNFFAVRQNWSNGDWEVIYADIGDTDQELQGEYGDSCVTDASFTAWLKRMVDTDGWPICPGDSGSETPIFERVD